MAAHPRKMKKLASIAVLLVIALIGARFGIDVFDTGGGGGGTATSDRPTATRDTAGSSAATAQRAPAAAADAAADESDIVLRAMRDQESGIMVTLVAEVVAVLPDDNEGSRHQRFLLGFEEPGAPYDSVLVAHNIDLAPRVPLERGDTVTVRGQYEFNDKGGVLHWTHHDPKQWREGGWIELDGERYE